MSIAASVSDPLSLALPPLVVARYRSPDGRAEVALRSSVWLDGAWWSCLDRTFRPGAGFLVPHRHEHTDEVHFIRAGVVRYVHGGRLHTARAGDVVRFPAGSVHADPWATRAGPATITSVLSPAAPEWIDFGMRLGAVTRSGKLNRHGQPPLPVVMRIVHEAGADVLAPGVPARVQRRAVIPGLAAVGRTLWRNDE